MKTSKGAVLTLIAALVLMFGSVTGRATQQSGSSGSSDQTDNGATARDGAQI